MNNSFEQARNLFVQGIADFEAGRFGVAEQNFQASLVLLPGRVSTLTNLAAAQIILAQPEAALAALDQAIASEPDNRDAWWHRGVALGTLGRHVEALAALDRLLGLAPDHFAGWLRQAQALQQLDRHEQALTSCDKALAITPDDALAWGIRGHVLKDLRRFDEAAQAFRQAIAHGGDHELNSYFLASVSDQPTPPASPAAYVRGLFDGYAESFDAHLVGVLHYQAHTVLARHLLSLAGNRRFARVLDLGCGTGLCGPLVQAVAAQIDGVDLSPTMLDKARALQVYSLLAQQDVVAFLQATQSRYDLVLAADVFIYIGDLDAVFAGTARVMDSGGVFCFSIETPDDVGQDFALKTSLRYGQSETYARALAVRHGFDVVELLHGTIREDQRQPIPGLYVYLRRS